MFLTIYAGFTHAFEADHLLAVSNIVTHRKRMHLAAKDGIYWGLGHTSTILLIGLLMIVFRMNIKAQSFHYFEAIVGFMLISLAVYRLWKFWQRRAQSLQTHLHTHHHDRVHTHGHKLAYGVGLVHGLAGSGSLIVLVMAQIKAPMDGVFYLLIFGLGSVAGMFLAAVLFSVPFSKKIIQSTYLQGSLVLLSAALCIIYGTKVIYLNLLA
jgi:cytochrome c biogenesis protein CcdA